MLLCVQTYPLPPDLNSQLILLYDTWPFVTVNLYTYLYYMKCMGKVIRISPTKCTPSGNFDVLEDLKNEHRFVAMVQNSVISPYNATHCALP